MQNVTSTPATDLAQALIDIAAYGAAATRHRSRIMKIEMKIEMNIPLNSSKIATSALATVRAMKQCGIVVQESKAFDAANVGGEGFVLAVSGEYNGADGIHGVARNLANQLRVSHVSLSKNGAPARMHGQTFEDDLDGQFPPYFVRVSEIAQPLA